MKFSTYFVYFPMSGMAMVVVAVAVAVRISEICFTWNDKFVVVYYCVLVVNFHWNFSFNFHELTNSLDCGLIWLVHLLTVYSRLALIGLQCVFVEDVGKRLTFVAMQAVLA